MRQICQGLGTEMARSIIRRRKSPIYLRARETRVVLKAFLRLAPLIDWQASVRVAWAMKI